MTSGLEKPAIEPSNAEPGLSHPDNQTFKALSRLVHPLSSWDRYSGASPQDRVTIERQWKDNWRSDDAQRLYQRAMACRAVGNPACEDHTDDHSTLQQPAPGEFARKLSFDEQIALHAADPAKYGRYLDWLFALNAPATKRWALRELLHRRDLDREREIARRDDYEVAPEQFGWRNR